jgi:hypothetical protein
MGAVAENQFEGLSNLTKGQRRLAETILAEYLAAARVDILALEAAGAIDGTAPTLTPGAEAADVIPVAFASPVAAVQQYIAEVYDTAMDKNDAAFTLAETGVGAEIVGTGTGRLIFTTDATGAAELSITDVVGASAANVFMTVRPLLNSAEVKQLVAPVEVDVTFD